MSRAFVKEDAATSDALPERAISRHRNFVTASGLAQMDAEIARLRAALVAISSAEIPASPLARDLRYWLARRASAELVEHAPDEKIVSFGSTVRIDRGDGREQRFRIVGEDEADPHKGSISYVAPLARALTGKSVGDVVEVNGHDVEILAIKG